MPNCKHSCKCAEGGCKPGENEEFLHAMEEELVRTEDQKCETDDPKIICNSSNGCDQVRSSSKLYCNGVFAICYVMLLTSSCCWPSLS